MHHLRSTSTLDSGSLRRSSVRSPKPSVAKPSAWDDSQTDRFKDGASPKRPQTRKWRTQHVVHSSTETPSTICLAMVERLAVWGSGGQLEDTFE